MVVEILGPLWEGAPPAGGGGENLTRPEIFRIAARFSPSGPRGATSLAEGGKKVVGKNFLNYTTPPCIL